MDSHKSYPHFHFQQNPQIDFLSKYKIHIIPLHSMVDPSTEEVLEHMVSWYTTPYGILATGGQIAMPFVT